jgi:hypothetical protein
MILTLLNVYLFFFKPGQLNSHGLLLVFVVSFFQFRLHPTIIISGDIKQLTVREVNSCRSECAALIRVLITR